MKRYFLLFGLLIVTLASCKKSTAFDAAAQAVTDDAAIQAYLKTHTNVAVTKDASGLYYQVIDPGTGAHPTATSGITVDYTANILDSYEVDKRSSSFFTPLGDLIKGWQIGIPKIGTGGTVLLIVPSGLGYANEDHGGIPANTVIVYQIHLQGFAH